LLVDNALSPDLARRLAIAGYDTLHVRDVGLASADDDTVLQKAREDGRVLISRDGDFAAILARNGVDRPSFVHLRTPSVNRRTVDVASDGAGPDHRRPDRGSHRDRAG
jgi:predicted nuclease of predicted toxin-antitoxin system